MIKKTGLIILAILCVMGCVNHNDEDIQKVKEVMVESYNAMERFATALDHATDNGEIVSAIHRYEQDLDTMLPKARQAEETMKKINGAHPPGELQDIIDKTKHITGPFLQSYKKVFEHSSDPSVHKALVSMMKKNNEMPAVVIW